MTHNRKSTQKRAEHNRTMVQEEQRYRGGCEKCGGTANTGFRTLRNDPHPELRIPQHAAQGKAPEPLRRVLNVRPFLCAYCYKKEREQCTDVLGRFKPLPNPRYPSQRR